MLIRIQEPNRFLVCIRCSILPPSQFTRPAQATAGLDGCLSPSLCHFLCICPYARRFLHVRLLRGHQTYVKTYRPRLIFYFFPPSSDTSLSCPSLPCTLDLNELQVIDYSSLITATEMIPYLILKDVRSPLYSCHSTDMLSTLDQVEPSSRSLM